MYNGRMNVQKGLKGNERGRIAAEALRSNGYVTLKTSEGYKCFNLDKVLAMKVGGRHIFCMGAECMLNEVDNHMEMNLDLNLFFKPESTTEIFEEILGY